MIFDEIKLARLWAVEDDMHTKVALESMFPQLGQPCVHQISALMGGCFVAFRQAPHNLLVDGSDKYQQ